MRRTVRCLAVAAWLLALAPLVPSTVGAAASGATLEVYGWWNRAQALPVEGDPTGLGLITVPSVPAPATVPEDGLYVSNNSDGAAAISAVRFLIDGQGGGTFTVRLAEGSTLTGTEEVVACPIVGGWEPAQNGRWESRPSYDEATCVVGAEPTEANDGLTFDVPSSFSSVLGDVSFVVAPAPDSTTPFSLAFEKPADGDFVVTTPVVSSPSAPPSAAPAYTPGSPVFTPQPSAPSFSSPSTPTATTVVALGDDETAAPAAPTAAVPAADVTDPSRTSQVFAVVVLVAIGAALWWLGSQPQRAPRLLGSVGGGAAAVAQPTATTVVHPSARARGVGRFVRPRSAPPTAI